jgi:hypothetical protein
MQFFLTRLDYVQFFIISKKEKTLLTLKSNLFIIILKSNIWSIHTNYWIINRTDKLLVETLNLRLLNWSITGRPNQFSALILNLDP